MPKGMHLAVEGIDGAGKTTVGQIVVARLKEKGERCQWSHDPASDGLGETVLAMWSQRNQEIGRRAWPLLFAASSIDAQCRPGGFLEALARGDCVVTDRCALSTVAEFLDETPSGGEWLLDIHREYRVPDLVIVLDVDPCVAADRVATRDGEPPDYQRAALSHERYLRTIPLCCRAGWRILTHRVDPQATPEETAASLLESIDDNPRLAQDW